MQLGVLLEGAKSYDETSKTMQIVIAINQVWSNIEVADYYKIA
jgi:hypothetical protein